MSKEKIRKALEGRFESFPDLAFDRKGYENRKDVSIPNSGLWAQMYITHGLRKITSIGDEPCTKRSGVLTIEVFDRKGNGTAKINQMTDSLEDHFSFFTAENLWLDAARTINDRTSGSYYLSTVYVPYIYDEN